jgi:nicotinamide phosphoribosyltransferase
LLGSWATMTNPEMIEFVPWQGHDFSFRGHTSFESAMLSGSGHMLSFFGTDTVPALEFLETYYQADLDKEIVGGSVAATEHSVMCMGGMDDEVETFRRLIEDVYPTGIVSIVSDTWDFWSVVDPENGICVKLKDKIMAREGKVVIRPDSGDPVKIVTGYMEEEISIAADGSYYDRETLLPLTANEVKGMIQCLYEIFGGTETTTGYIQLDSHIGAIYGDSITLQRASDICSRLERKGFASTNLVYGIGSYTYQYVTRDTFGFAVKSTYGEVRDPDGKIEGIEIFKDPKTDDGLKKSAKGLTAVYASEKGDFYMKDQATWDDVTNCAFVNVFADGILKQRWSLAEVRATLNS